jgi:hypothetical protein
MSFFLQFDSSDDRFNAEVTAKASRLGLVFGFVAPVQKNDWSENCAVAGNTFAIKDTLKANGARWNGIVKVWTFTTYAALENAINAIKEN